MHAEAVAEFEGYEHAHWALQYRGEAIRAGFSTRLIEPSYHWFFRTPPPPVPPPLRDLRARAQHELKSRALGRRAYLMWINHIAGGRVVRNDCHQAPSADLGASFATFFLEVFGDRGRRAVEDDKAEHEHAERDRDRQPEPPRSSDSRARARRRRIDHRVAELLQHDRERVDHVQMDQGRRRRQLLLQRFRTGR